MNMSNHSVNGNGYAYTPYFVFVRNDRPSGSSETSDREGMRFCLKISSSLRRTTTMRKDIYPLEMEPIAP
jgi:hypothetical protein